MKPGTTAQFDQPIKHLLVDLDGTLLGNHPVHLSFDFAKQALLSLKKFMGWRKAARTLLAIHKELGRTSGDQTNDIRVIELFAKRMNISSEESRRMIRDELFAIFPSLSRYFFPIPGAREFLDWAKTRYPLTLATNPVWPKEIIELRVRWAGIDPAIFGFITYVKLMHTCKPNPAYFSEVLAYQNLNPSDCLLIGDNVKMDLPATEAGIPVFIVGRHEQAEVLEHKNAKAKAWRGSYLHLRDALERTLSLV